MKMRTTLTLIVAWTLLAITDFGLGQQWAATSLQHNAYPWHSIAASANFSKIVVTGYDYGYGFSAIYTSQDSGMTWTQTASGQKVWTAVTISADGTKVVAAGRFSPLVAGSGAIIASDTFETNWTATWDSLFIAPRFQEYMSNNAVLTSSVMQVLSLLLGDEHTFTLTSPAYPKFHVDIQPVFPMRPRR